MFMFDVETLGKESNSVILSMACIHFDPDNKPSPQQLRDNTFFCKFDASDQIKGYIAPLVAPPWIGGQNNVRMSRLNHSNRMLQLMRGLKKVMKE